MGIFSKPSSGPSAEEIANKQRQAAEKERQKIALEQAQTDARQEQALQQSFSEQQSRRKALSSGLVEDDEQNRRKFLKGV